jgi:hypothetical protein
MMSRRAHAAASSQHFVEDTDLRLGISDDAADASSSNQLNMSPAAAAAPSLASSPTAHGAYTSPRSDSASALFKDELLINQCFELLEENRSLRAKTAALASLLSVAEMKLDKLMHFKSQAEAEQTKEMQRRAHAENQLKCEFESHVISSESLFSQ